MTALLTDLAAHGKITLVVHAAGVVGNTGPEPLRTTSTEHVAAHVHAKVAGALALAAALAALPEHRQPRTVLLMSSATTLVGGIGMGPYAASNAALDALAAAAPDRGPRWISAVWDGWRVGPLGGERTVVLTDALDAATGTRAFDRIIAATSAGKAPPVVAISATDLGVRVAAASAPTSPAGGPGGSGTELTPVQRAISQLWSGLFGRPVTSADADFFALGGHSLLATRMLGAVRDRFGIELRLRDLLAAPTVAALAERIETDAPGPGAADPAPRGEPGVPADGTFPLTRVQHAYWVGATAATAGGTCRATSTWSTTAPSWTCPATRRRGTGSSPGTRCSARPSPRRVASPCMTTCPPTASGCTISPAFRRIAEPPDWRRCASA